MQLTRRGMVIGTLAGGGLALGFVLRPRHFPLPLPARSGEIAFDAWIKIGSDGVISIAVPQLEMGQGITTLIPQIAAMELGADWRQIAVEPAPPAAQYANLPLAAQWSALWMPVLPSLAEDADGFAARRWAEDTAFNVTADGTAIAAYEAPVRAAAASVRTMLAMAAAKRWDIGWEECEARGGFIRHGGKRLAFAELAEEAAGFAPPDPPVLLAVPPRERPSAVPVGGVLPFPRLDLPAKVDGSFVFAGDVRLPDMLHAAIRHGPIGETTLDGYDKAAGGGTPGLVSVIRHDRWLAAAATNWWAAERALAAMLPRFKSTGRASSEAIEAALDKGLRTGDARLIHQNGDPDSVMAGKSSLALRYEVAPALHAGVETASATARLRGGKLELWVAAQAPEAARLAAAAALGMKPRDVVLYPMPAGGSFDARLEHGHAVEAALIARETGRPVQLTWSRWQEHVAGLPRTPVSAMLSAQISPSGELIGWKSRLALPGSAQEFGERLFGGKSAQKAMAAAAGRFDPIAMAGAVPPYAVANMAIEHVPVAIGLPTGRMRGNAHGYTAFFTECFIDELAALARSEPLSYRIAMLGGDPRLVQCLQRVSSLANWNGGRDGSGQGLACHVIANGPASGRIAAIATARRDETGVRVDKISAVADIGRIINVDIARQQIEGGLVFGIGLALGSSTTYAAGKPATARLGALGLPLLADCPQIEVDFIDSNAAPADPGELGVAVAAPAIANALFSATGLRLRRLPLLSEDV